MNAEDRRGEILRHLERYGVRDKDAGTELPQSRRGEKNITRNRRGRFRKTIDLHGMVSVNAERILANTLAECKKRGIKELLIIHGRGTHSDPMEGGILKKLVRDNLEFRYSIMVRKFGPALAKDGGEGATVVVLK